MPHAIIIGGSMGGLFAANLLITNGWDITVFERSKGNLAGRGAGLGSQPPLFQTMKRLGLSIDANTFYSVEARQCLDFDGKTIVHIPLHNTGTAWDVVYGQLRRALPDSRYQQSMEFVGLDQSGKHVTAFFQDGTSATGDLLIGADGLHSEVRHKLAPSVKPEYAGYVSWRSLVPSTRIQQEHRKLLSENMNFCLPDGEMVMTTPVPQRADEPGILRCQFSWFRPADISLIEDLCTDAAGNKHGTSIPPPLIRPELIQRLKTRAKEILAPQVAALIHAAENMILQPIFDLASERMVFGRVVLLGDAAFVARPHVGTGVTKVALDAAALADALTKYGGDIAAALKSYEFHRLKAGQGLVDRGRYLGQYLSGQIKPRDERTAAEMYRLPERYLQEFGAAGTIQSV